MRLTLIALCLWVAGCATLNRTSLRVEVHPSIITSAPLQQLIVSVSVGKGRTPRVLCVEANGQDTRYETRFCTFVPLTAFASSFVVRFSEAGRYRVNVALIGEGDVVLGSFTKTVGVGYQLALAQP